MITLRVVAALALPLLGFCGNSFSQSYPTKPVTVIVPSGAGGAADLVARIITRALETETKQPFLVINQAGATNTIGIRTVVTAPPDGYTLLISTATSSLATSAVFVKDLPFDVVKDLQPVSMIGDASSVLVVNNSVPAKDLSEFIKLIRGSPGKFNYGATSIGSVGHMHMESFKQAAKLDMMPVFYKQTSQLLPDLIAGRIQAWITPIPAVISNINSGGVRALATTGLSRAGLLRQAPMISETAELKGFSLLSVYAMFTRAGIPKPTLDRLNELTRKVVDSPQVKTQLSAQGVDAMSSDPQAVRDVLVQYIARWAALVKAVGISVEE
jgi:tripartite-type tricarboxylate transporter receptor subunit TctC